MLLSSLDRWPSVDLNLHVFGWKLTPIFVAESAFVCFHLKYLENGESYDVGLKGHQIGNQTWAFDWHCELWLRMTLSHLISISLKYDIKYFENGNTYDDGVNGCRIGNHPRAINWHHDLWPWWTLYCLIDPEVSLQMCRKRWEIRCWTQRKPTFGFLLALWSLTTDDLQSYQFRVIKIWYEIFRKRWQIRSRRPPLK